MAGQRFLPLRQPDAVERALLRAVLGPDDVLVPPDFSRGLGAQ